MLYGLPRNAKPGDRVPLTLRFERAGAVRIDAVARSGSDAGSHAHH
jgi:copper(I)-binding protein